MTIDLESLRGKHIFGIDLGTTKSGISVWKPSKKRVEMVRYRYRGKNETITPSVVGWDREQDRWLVGLEAQEFAQRHPEHVARSMKRYIGRWYDDHVVAENRAMRAFVLEPGSGESQLLDIWVNFGVDGNGSPVRLSAPDVSREVLKKLRTDAVADEGVGIKDLAEVKYVVISVPAYFNALQRDATKLAGANAGLEVIGVINEPTAAALAYRSRFLEMDKAKRIMVYDLGGGTFDVSILTARKDKLGFSLQTLVVDGDTHLGGDDIDTRVVEWLVRQIEEQQQVRVLADNRVAREQLRQAAEKAKRELSNKTVTTVLLEQLEVDDAPPVDIRVELTRKQIEACAADVLRRTRDICYRAVEQIARLSWREIDAIVLVGGQTLMPAVQRDIEDFSGQKPLALPRPQEAVALGAGEYARTLSLGGERFAERALANVVALPVGLYLPFDVPNFQPLIKANTTLPARTPEPELVKTAMDGQDHAEITILQGKQYDASDRSQCTEIGTVRRDGILPGPKGSRVFGIVIDITEDGSIDVTVSDPTGRMKPLQERITDKPVIYYCEHDECYPKRETQSQENPGAARNTF